MSRNKTTETISENRPPVTYLVALNDKLQMNADKVERNIIEAQHNLNKDIRRINEERQPIYQEYINKTILNSLDLLNSLNKDVAEASRLQHPQSEMIEKDMKQLRERVMKLREEYDRIYKCSSTVNGEKKIHMKLDDSEWEVQRPSEVTSDADIKYSVSSSEGQHECSETGLRWSSGSDVSLEYSFVDWKSLNKNILKKYKPCGPLMDITVTSGRLEEIQLPHFVCVDSSLNDAVKALHVKDGTVSVETCELSGFHAKLVNPTFSFLAIVVEVQQYLKMKFHCETLVYRNRTSPLNLHVYLILKDKKLKKDVEEKEQNNMEILKPTPDEALTIHEHYTLKTSCDSKIKPQSLKLTPGKTNFFDLHIKEETECVELCIETKDGQKVWDVNIEPGEFDMNSSVSEWRQKKNHGAFWYCSPDEGVKCSPRICPEVLYPKSALIWQWWRQLFETARNQLETPLLPPANELRRLRLDQTFQSRFSALTGHQSADTDTAQKQKKCKRGEGAEFVEKHRADLIRKVSLVEPIADDMKHLIGDEKYQIILKSLTKQEKMRTLLDFLTTPKMKDKLYQSLVKHEHYVVEYLEKFA